MTDNPHAPPTSQSAKPVAWRYHYPGAEELAEVRLYEGMSCEEEAAGMVETPLYAHPPATASQSDEALINVGPINRIPGTDSISCPGLPSGMMCLGWGEQGWAINDKDGKRIAAGNWGECATLPASQSEALVEAIADYNDILRSCAAVAQRQGQNTSWDALGRRIKTILKKHHSTWLEYCGDAGTD